MNFIDAVKLLCENKVKYIRLNKQNIVNFKITIIDNKACPYNVEKENPFDCSLIQIYYIDDVIIMKRPYAPKLSDIIDDSWEVIE